jgi:hypothetical protein
MRLGFSGRGRNLFPAPLPGQATALGNNLPPITGWDSHGYKPGPSPSVYSGAQGQLGEFDGYIGADPRVDRIQPRPFFLPGNDAAGMDSGTANNPGAWRGGLQGFNDRLTVKDRHAYWDTGNQKTGVGFSAAGAPPNAYNDPQHNPPRPDLRLTQRTVSYQKGSDKTRNQDDLTRGYTWLGEQGSGWTRISGGVPGLFQPYGTRGGVPFPIQSPVAEGAEGDGPHLVFAGPPHGLHSTTPWKGGEQIISRATVLPQMRPVRFDRPSNSPQAGQSYSQTVRPQGATRVRPSERAGTTGTAPRTGQVYGGGRGWAGRKTGPGT